MKNVKVKSFFRRPPKQSKYKSRLGKMVYVKQHFRKPPLIIGSNNLLYYIKNQKTASQIRKTTDEIAEEISEIMGIPEKIDIRTTFQDKIHYPYDYGWITHVLHPELRVQTANTFVLKEKKDVFPWFLPNLLVHELVHYKYDTFLHNDFFHEKEKHYLGMVKRSNRISYLLKKLDTMLDKAKKEVIR